MKNPNDISAIPSSESDRLLHSWGFDLIDEYYSVAQQIPPTQKSVLELATGTGRMCAVLAALFPRIISGDISLAGLPRVKQRVADRFLSNMVFIQLDMELLPFKHDSVSTIVCMNTLHETKSPARCIQEMVRVLDPDGTLIIGDFNDRGFDAMQRIHEVVYKNDHDRGTMTIDQAATILLQDFTTVRWVETQLNRSVIVSGKNIHK